MTCEPLTFDSALARQARERPTQVALRHAGRATDYATLDRQANQIANGLLSMGLGKGDRVAYVGKNSDRAIALTFGAARAGLVLVPVIWRLAPAEIDGIMADATPGALFVEPAFADRAAPPGHVIVMDDRFDAWRDAQSTALPQVETLEDDVVIQLYTSGTTGKPKGVRLTHGNGIRHRINQQAAGVDWLLASPGDATIVAMPYGHIAGIGVALNAVETGQEVLVHAEFDAVAVMEAIEGYRVRYLFLVPAALGLMLAHPRAMTTDFSSIATLSYGASPIPLPLLQKAIARIGCGFSQVYGMTETWGSIVSLSPADHLPGREHKMTAAGKALPGVELRILDDTGTPVSAGVIGEVSIRSPSNMVAYWNKPVETAQALTGDGWLRTGDAGLLDEEGYLFIQDRIKDMIITGAENVYPAEVESAVYGHPAVADVAVIGVPDPKWGEAVKAIVVLRPGFQATADDIISHSRTHIAGFKCPKSVDFVAVLPRNPSGKILRRELRMPYWAARERQVN